MQGRDQGQGDASTSVPEISPHEAWRRLSDAGAPPAPVLVDVREAWEFVAGHAHGAVNVPLSAFRERFGEIPRDRQVLVICHVGQRSMLAAKFLRQQGFARVANVEGGTEVWEQAGLPLER